jgi:RNA ligase (TIGR02306 family)
MRKLATIRKIDDIRPIEGADAIECAVIGGWVTVIKKGEFKVGDLAVYCEIDSWIPNTIAPFLSKDHAPREYMGVKGERLRTVKLRGQVSQGLLLSLKALPTALIVNEGDDVSEVLSINKYEPPVPAQLAGQIEGAFPGYIPKTDQERIQNLVREYATWQSLDYTWEETEKLDGTSMTVFRTTERPIGVCSRNWEVRETEGNTFWTMARTYDLESVLKALGNVAIQGEVIGPGIQKNKYGLSKHEFFVYDIFDIDAQRYYTPSERISATLVHGLTHVPVIKPAHSFAGMSVEDALAYVVNKSVIGTKPEREGSVFKCNMEAVSFKIISNKFLLRNGDE